MLVVAALGGNALLRRGESPDVENQARNVALAATALSGIARESDLVVTHGNGPQVGLLALQSEALEGVAAAPLDVLGAEAEGMIGYLLARELRGRLPGREVATLLTQTEVDPDDPGFQEPTKAIGPVYDADGARRLAAARGWCIAQESAGGHRRVVASPEPVSIIELAAIRLLVSAHVVVTCAGGGGVPVAKRKDGTLRGVEAVVDKDLATALLATEIGADSLLLLTDQPGVFSGWPDRGSALIRTASVEEMRTRRFEAGTMGPKVEAACRFVESTGASATIGHLADTQGLLEQRAGTRITAR